MNRGQKPKACKSGMIAIGHEHNDPAETCLYYNL